MTEDDAQDWLRAQGWWEGVPGDRLRRLAALVLEESDRQNLISAASRAQIWSRHIVDSAQLLMLPTLGPARGGCWVDLGTGAGFPGLVIACLRPAPIVLVEVRPLRVAFLDRAARSLGLDHVTVMGTKVEKVTLPTPASVISARAYAPLDKLLASAHHLADENTVWLLPKGRNGEKELAIARTQWQAVFHVEQSLTDPDSVIITAQGIAPRKVLKRSVKPMNSRRNRR